MELERVLTKLRYDEKVIGYALVTNQGIPFLSFSLPDETLPAIQGTLFVYKDSLKLMNVMTGSGTVILARIDPNWVLSVLFHSDESLGSALQKTQDVIDLLEGTELPPPPSTKLETMESPEIPEATTESIETTESSLIPIAISEIDVRHGCIVHKGPFFSETGKIDSTLYKMLVDQFGNVALDILMMVDDKKTVFKLAETLGKRVEIAIEVVKWSVSQHIVTIECPEEQTHGATEIVELPIFEGDLKKAKKEHRLILSHCDGTKTLQEIAEELGIPYFNALQSVVSYRGKTLKFIKKSKKVMK